MHIHHVVDDIFAVLVGNLVVLEKCNTAIE